LKIWKLSCHLIEISYQNIGTVATSYKLTQKIGYLENGKLVIIIAKVILSYITFSQPFEMG